MRRLSSHGILIALAAAFTALVLTVVRPIPEGLVRFGLGDREVRAAPGESSKSLGKHDLTALEVFNVTLVRIRDAYVDPSRIDPKQMLYSALDSVQFNIPEVLVESYPDDDRVVVVVNDKKQTFATSDVDSAWRLSGKLKKIFRFIEAHMNAGADLARVEYAAINGMLNTLDPHSVLLDPETAREMDVSTSGKFGGLGIVIGMRNQKLTVLRPIKSTPAEDAGIMRGDHIVQIGDEVTEHLTLQEAVERMRGTPNTPITIWIERNGQDQRLRFDLNRAIIRVESVDYRLLEGDVGYIRVRQFSGRTSDEVRDAMRDLEGQGAQGWVLDMRYNPGGLLEQAIKVSDLFIDRGTIVTTVGGREREPRRARRKGTNQLPMSVLVNDSSASASEIVAGALKNLDRALIIGTNTFGKGTVQVLYDNKDGSKLKLTIAQYLTPGDRSIQSLGIVPDLELQRMLVPEKNDSPTDYLRLFPASRSYREKDLDAHLTSRYVRDGEKPKLKLSYVYETPQRDDLQADGETDTLPPEEFVEDFEIRLARDLVTGMASAANASRRANRKQMLSEAGRIIDRHRLTQETNLAAAFAKLGVDWSLPADADKQAAPKLEAEITTAKRRYQAGEDVELVGTVHNRGAGPAYRVHARIKADDPAFEDTEFAFGMIPPGESRTFHARVKVPKDAIDRVDQINFAFSEARGHTASAPPLSLRIVAAERPVFAYSHQLIDSGNGDGLVQSGERHTLRVTIKNTGKGVAEKTTALLRNASGDTVVLKKARFEIGALQPGTTQSVDFVFEVAKDAQEPEVVVEMTVYDGELHESVVEKLRYPLRDAGPAPKRESGYIKVTSNRAPIYEGAAGDAARIASARGGALFRVTGKQGPWYRIALPNTESAASPDKSAKNDKSDARPGFINITDVRKTSARPRGDRRDRRQLDTYWQVTPPELALEIPSYVTDSGNYKLSGTASDDEHVEDIYIFVSNFADRVENKKVFYKSNRRGKKTDALNFETEIPLWVGTNQVTVVARENDEVRSQHTMFIYRTEGNLTAFAPLDADSK